MLLALVHLAFADSVALPDQGCRATRAELLVSLDGADAAWGVEEDSFRAAITRLEAALPCLVEPLAPTDAARVHRALGLSAWLARDTAAATAAFAAARAADPAYTFPEAMVPAANPVRRAYEGAPTEGPTTVLAPPRGKLLLDGVVSRVRVEDRPVVVQIVYPTVTTTTWVAAGAPVPAWPVRGKGLRVPLLIGAGAAAAGAGALAALAGDLRANPPVPTSEDDLQAIGARNHGMVYGAAGLGVAAVGLGVTAFVVGEW